MPILTQNVEDMVKNVELLRRIGERANDLNNRERGYYGELFAAFQTALKTECILAAARVYDNPSKMYPTR